jgi:hypothetical protein
VRNFIRPNKPINISGYAQHYFIEDDRIVSLPLDADGIINLNNIVYTDPAHADWYVGSSVLKTLDLGNNVSVGDNGSVNPINIEGVISLQGPENVKLFHEKTFKRFIVIVRDRNGNLRVCGEPGNGLKFSFKDIKGGISFSYTAQYTHPCWYAIGNFSVNGSSSPIGIPTTAIARIVDTAGGLLSTHTIPAGLTTDITAPDAIFTVNGDDFLQVKSGSGTDVETVNQFDDPLIPTIVGNKLIFTEDRSIIIDMQFSDDGLETSELLITSYTAGTFTIFTQDGSSGTITYSINGSTPAPLTGTIVLADTNIYKLYRTTPGAIGWVKSEGIY